MKYFVVKYYKKEIRCIIVTPTLFESLIEAAQACHEWECDETAPDWRDYYSYHVVEIIV